MAASWSWGSSLATGIALALTFGLPAWWFWAVPNFFVIPALGLYYDRIPQFQKTIRLWPMAVFMGVLQIFVLWVNTQAIFEISSGGVDLQTTALMTPLQATVFAIGTGLFFRGFRSQIRTIGLDEHRYHSVRRSGWWRGTVDRGGSRTRAGVWRGRCSEFIPLTDALRGVVRSGSPLFAVVLRTAMAADGEGR